MFKTFASIIVMMVTYPFGFFNIPRQEIPPGTQRATILVHGFLHNQSTWYYLKYRLKRYPELGSIITFNLGHPFQSIEDYTRKLQAKIAEIKSKSKKQKIELNLVGHSMGGLVCVNYAVKFAEQDHVKVSKIVTLASPLQGTPAAKLAPFSVAGKEMLPNSSFINQLQKEAYELKETKLYQIGCGVDYIVPPQCSFFAGHYNDYLFPHLGHFSVLYSSNAADQIIHFLRNSL